MRESVLVTGGAGFIGAHVCKALNNAGYVPVAYDNLSQGHRDSVRWGPLDVGDLADAARLKAVMLARRPVAVIHLAAHLSVSESVANPAKYYDNNVGATLTLLAVMRETGVRRMVLSSSGATYGRPRPTVTRRLSASNLFVTTRRMASGPFPCGISTRPGPTRMANLAKGTNRRLI